ncbi:hypothetical protein ABZ741_39240 [Streptomyces globisporus]|uniref:hypothetical protein n=1 Tax=Streptomyces globisporus TaxID=1908 RepID=UPI0034614E61|nr:hypothetical protein OG838_09580 [Streptomyces globisporus]WSV89503.1 hypothetical protein OG449_09155 [Streptomyces globisporus]
MPNPALEAAYAAIPELVEHRERKERIGELHRTVPTAEAPEIAAQKVVNEALEEYLRTGVMPADVEARATEAYTASVGAHALRSAVGTLYAGSVHTQTLEALREANAPEILAALGAQLAALLKEARKHTEALGAVRTADEALTEGGKAAEAYTALRALLPTLRDIRSGQWDTLRLGQLTGPGCLYQRAKDSGFGDVQGVNDDTPRGQFTAMQNQRYTLDHLVWLAQIGTAYIPESVEDILAAQYAYETRHSVSDAPPVIDLSPKVVPNPPAPAPKPGPVHGRKSAPAHVVHHIN